MLYLENYTHKKKFVVVLQWFLNNTQENCNLYLEKMEEKVKEPIKEPSEEPLPMETEEEESKEEPIKELIKEVKGLEPKSQSDFSHSSALAAS